MSMSIRALGWTALLASFVFAQPPTAPPQPAHNPGTAGKVELGKLLFSEKRLSADGKVSCATCHDPQKGFVDGIEQSKGILQMAVGRNAPSMIAMGHVASFPVPIGHGKELFGRQARERRVRIRGFPPQSKVKAVSLEERCLGPIENPLEMGDSIAGVVHALNEDPEMRRRFDAAFSNGWKGVTRDRMGKALAAFLRSLELPRARFQLFLDGDTTALNDEERDGLAIFEGVGRCNDCHSGPGLSDGKMHRIAMFNSPRAQWRRKVAQTRQTELQRKLSVHQRNAQKLSKAGKPGSAHEARMAALIGRVLTPPQGRVGGYGQDLRTFDIQAHTLPLWDVPRTGPYFRDGSAKRLDVAVAQHITEMRAVAASRRSNRASVAAIPTELKPSWAASPPPAPGELRKDELGKLMAFLRTLSAGD